MSDLFDALEARDSAVRERDLLAALPALIAQAKSAPGWAAILQDVQAGDITSRAALAQLPVTRKSDLKELQQAALPFGGLNSTPTAQLSRIFMSPGPIFDPEGRGEDYWRYARPFHALGVRSGDIIQNCFAYHFTPAGLMVEGGAAKPAGEPPDPDADPHARSQLQAEWADVSAHLARLGSEVARRDAQITTARAAVARLDATLPLARQREADVKGLSAQGFMSGHAGQDRERERIVIEQDLLTERARLAEALAAQRESADARAAYLAETRRALNDRQAQAALKRQQLTQERSKADQRRRLTQLVAPVDGTVQQVAVHTAGGVVTPAQVLMVIVPRDAQVTAEVVIDNKDIGFVNAGQPAVIKLETFAYTRYGTVAATVSRVSADAVSDDQRGAIFPAVLALQQTQLDVDGKRIGLSPGMNLSAEIATGQRRVIDYLLSPVRQALGESLRER